MDLKKAENEGMDWTRVAIVFQDRDKVRAPWTRWWSLGLHKI